MNSETLLKDLQTKQMNTLKVDEPIVKDLDAIRKSDDIINIRNSIMTNDRLVGYKRMSRRKYP
jgi:hypothetical protein